jgi:peptidoglycan/LPS O-acetylase OafA/YrhL
MHMNAHRRLDIQILRGFAISAVVLFHTDERLLPGGFLGVDIFFIISGFVVSPLIQRIWDVKGLTNQKMEMRAFFLRRIYRLLPAFLSSLIVSIPIVLLFTSPSEHIRFFKQSSASLLAVGNFGAYLFNGNYFDPNPNPMVHTWSLAVEEQIYVILPFIVLFLSFAFQRRISYRTVILVLTLLSLCLKLFQKDISGLFNNIGISDYESLTFYSPVHRFWQFGIGAFLATSKWNIVKLSSKFLLPILLSLVFVSLMFPESEFAITIFVSVIILIILYFNLHVNEKNLFVRILVWLGDRSYSIYLLHLPLLYVVRYSPIFFDISSFERIICTLATLLSLLLVGNIQFRFIESRYRLGFLIQSKRRKILFLLGTQGFVWSLIAISWFSVDHDYFGLNRNIKVAAYAADFDPNCSRERLTGPGCVYGSDPLSRKALLIGDSHAGHISQAFVDAALENGWTAIVWAQPMCHVEFDSILRKNHSQACIERNKDIREWINENRPGLVLVSQFIYRGFDQYEIKSTLSSISKKSGRVVVLRNTPVFPDSRSFMVQRPLIMGPDKPRKSFKADEMVDDHDKAEEALILWAKRSGIRTLDISSSFCNASVCKRFSDSKWLYRDDDHLSIHAQKLIQPMIETIFK